MPKKDKALRAGEERKPFRVSIASIGKPLRGKREGEVVLCEDEKKRLRQLANSILGQQRCWKNDS